LRAQTRFPYREPELSLAGMPHNKGFAMRYERPEIARQRVIAQMDLKRSCPAGKTCVEVNDG